MQTYEEEIQDSQFVPGVAVRVDPEYWDGQVRGPMTGIVLAHLPTQHFNEEHSYQQRLLIGLDQHCVMRNADVDGVRGQILATLDFVRLH